MHDSTIVKLTFIFGICFVFGLLAEGSTTCKDSARKLKSFEDEIERLNLAVEEYRLASGEYCEDVSDECNHSTTCSKCLRENSYLGCGWCTLRNRCSLEKNCPRNDTSSNFWISGSDRCPKIRAVKPHQINAVRAKMLEITIPDMPDYEGAFICSFQVLGKTLVTKGDKTDRGITCASPHPHSIPSIPFGHDHTAVKLSVRTPNGPNFASTSNFTVYDCRRLNSCTECVSSPFPCAWCFLGDRCTHNVNENCRNDIIIFSKYVTRPTIRQGPAFCTRILPQTGVSNEMLVHSGSKRRVSVKVENIQTMQVSSRFTCKVSGIPEVTAHLLGDVVYCEMMEFRVRNREPISNLSFSVLSGGVRIDNTENLHVAVYHCGLMASSCGECLSLPEKFGCGWCGRDDSCSIRDNCASEFWMDNRLKCRNPKITSFSPRSALPTQQTNITIRGINLGKEFKDIEGVTIINEDSEAISVCVPHEDLFVSYSQIVCLLDVAEIFPENNGTLQGFVEVRFSNDAVAISDEEFSFVEPIITEFEPVKGIVAGGTLLKIMGHNLDAGNEVEVFIKDLPCKIISRDASTIQCITSPVPAAAGTQPSPMSSAVRVVFDGEVKTTSSYYFYLENPYIDLVKSEGGLEGPVGTLSGGNLIVVEGGNFDHISNPYIYVIVDGIEYPGLCTVESDTHMECLSPKIPSETLNYCSEEGDMAFDYGFKMGDTEELQNISLNKDFRKYRLYPDPYFMPFPEEGRIKVLKSDYMTINGRLLDTVFNEESFTVRIGDKECTLTSVSHTQLTCKPPKMQPDAANGDPNMLPEVVMRTRACQEYFIGFLRYDKD